MRRSLLSVVALALACSSTAREKKTPRQRPLPIQVRQGAGTVYALSKEAGEYALHCLARSATLEDCWIYCNGRWVDIGVNESPEGVSGDATVLRKLARNPLVEYHIHPRNAAMIYPPSSNDIICHATLKRALRPLGIALESKVLDGDGMWTYTVSQDVETFLSLKNVKQHGITFEELLRALIATTTAPLIDGEYRLRDKLIQRYIQEVSAFGVLVKYRKLH